MDGFWDQCGIKGLQGKGRSDLEIPRYRIPMSKFRVLRKIQHSKFPERCGLDPNFRRESGFHRGAAGVKKAVSIAKRLKSLGIEPRPGPSRRELYQLEAFLGAR